MPAPGSQLALPPILLSLASARLSDNLPLGESAPATMGHLSLLPRAPRTLLGVDTHAWHLPRLTLASLGVGDAASEQTETLEQNPQGQRRGQGCGGDSGPRAGQRDSCVVSSLAVCVCVYVCVCTSMRVHVCCMHCCCVHVCAPVHVCTGVLCTCTCTHTCVCSCVCVCARVCTCVSHSVSRPSGTKHSQAHAGQCPCWRRRVAGPSEEREARTDTSCESGLLFQFSSEPNLPGPG